MPFPSPHPHSVALCTALTLVCGLAAQAECLAPMPPEKVTDPGLRAEYQSEITAEYSTYFDEAQAYLRCLEETRAATIAEVNQVPADYQSLGIGRKD